RRGGRLAGAGRRCAARCCRGGASGGVPGVVEVLQVAAHVGPAVGVAAGAAGSAPAIEGALVARGETGATGLDLALALPDQITGLGVVDEIGGGMGGGDRVCPGGEEGCGRGSEAPAALRDHLCGLGAVVLVERPAVLDL